MIEQIVAATGEAFPTIEVHCIQHVGIIIAAIMVVICVYLTVVNGMMSGHFSTTFTLLGVILTAIIVCPALTGYLQHKDAQENEDPYKVELLKDPLGDPEAIDHLKRKLMGTELDELPADVKSLY